MTTGQQITLGLAVALVIASLWRGQQVQHIWQLIATNQGYTSLTVDLRDIGLDLLFLVIVVWVAGWGPSASKITGALLVALWILFLMHAPNLQAGNPASWVKK